MKAYQDINHSGNKIRMRVRCKGCGVKGCTTGWGPWCFSCNNKRIDNISSNLEKIAAGKETK